MNVENDKWAWRFGGDTVGRIKDASQSLVQVAVAMPLIQESLE